MRGLLLINVGTPAGPTKRDVKRYLREFLSDPRVIDLSPLARWLLLTFFILPFRPKKSASAYQAIWTDRGSPLLALSEDLLERVREEIGAEWKVELGMRYGTPSIAGALARLLKGGVDDIVLFPLYPQYSSAATGSALEIAFAEIGRQWVVPPIATVPPFFADTGFIDAFTALGEPILSAEKPDHVLFSFHGLPERHMQKADVSGEFCLRRENCCDELRSENRNCYRAQCFATARALASRLRLDASRFDVSFQSRLGRTPWIAPHTDRVLSDLAKAGKRRLLVFCPAFVADCLETLEEIAIRGERDFKNQGGERLVLVPSLNASPRWVTAVIDLARRAHLEVNLDKGKLSR